MNRRSTKRRMMNMRRTKRRKINRRSTKRRMMNRRSTKRKVRQVKDCSVAWCIFPFRCIFAIFLFHFWNSWPSLFFYLDFWNSSLVFMCQSAMKLLKDFFFKFLLKTRVSNEIYLVLINWHRRVICEVGIMKHWKHWIALSDKGFLSLTSLIIIESGPLNPFLVIMKLRTT